MRKKLLKYLIVLVLILPLTMSSCSDDHEDEDEVKLNGEQNDPIVEQQDPFVTSGFSLELGKSQKESAVKVLSNDEAIYIVGHTEADYGPVSDFEDFNGGYHDLYITKLNRKGEIEWEKCFGTDLSEKSVDAHLTEDGDLIVLGNVSTMMYGGGGLGHLQGSSDAMVWRINKLGEIVWQLAGANNNDDEYIQAGLIFNNSLLAFYTKGFSRGLACLKIDLTKGLINETIALEYEEYVTITKARKSDDGGILLVGKARNNAAIIKLSSSLQVQWFSDNGGSSGEIAYDIAETSNGYLLVGTTGSSQLALGDHNLYPYYRIIHDPVFRGSETYLLKTDKKGQFKCTSWTSGNNNNVTNTGWQIGIGYLESNWGWEYSGMNRQPDNGRFIKKMSDDNFLVLGTGTRHSDGNGVSGAGENGIPQVGLMSMRVDPNFAMKDNKANDVYITWEKQFYENVLLSKNFFELSEGIVDVFETEESYLFLGKKDDNIYVSALDKSEVEK